jgi:outer membrane protein
VQVAQDELQLEQSINDLQKAKVDLLIAMNENPERSFEISGNYADSNLKSNDLRAILSKLGSTQTLVSRALTNRDDLKNLEQNIEINRMKLDIAGKTLYFPTVNAFSNYNMSGNAIGELTNTRVFQIGINFSYPIFQGFRLDVQRQIAEVNVRQREEDLTNARKIVGGNIKKTQLDMESIIKQVEILDRNIASARLDVELTTENYRVGYGTLLDVQTATTKLNNLLIQRSNAIYNFLQLRKLLEYYTGDLKL